MVWPKSEKVYDAIGYFPTRPALTWPSWVGSKRQRQLRAGRSPGPESPKTIAVNVADLLPTTSPPDATAQDCESECGHWLIGSCKRQISQSVEPCRSTPRPTERPMTPLKKRNRRRSSLLLQRDGSTISSLLIGDPTFRPLFSFATAAPKGATFAIFFFFCHFRWPVPAAVIAQQDRRRCDLASNPW